MTEERMPTRTEEFIAGLFHYACDTIYQIICFLVFCWMLTKCAGA